MRRTFDDENVIDEKNFNKEDIDETKTVIWRDQCLDFPTWKQSIRGISHHLFRSVSPIIDHFFDTLV